MSDQNEELDMPKPSPFNTEIRPVFGAARSHFTKTPFAVTRDYFDGPGPSKAAPAVGKGSVARKRRALADGVDLAAAAAASKKSKGKAAAARPAAPASESKESSKGKATAVAAAAAAPAAPDSKAKKSSKGKAAAAATLPAAPESEVNGAFEVRAKSKRQYNGKSASARAIPKTLEDCDAADQMLIAWRDGKKDWAPIKAEWLRLTGETTAQSTLPNRYARLKANFATLDEEDSALLLQAKREIEDSFHAQKWTMVANMLHARSGSDYTSRPKILQRHWKRLMIEGGAKMPAGLVDPDFDMGSLGSGDDDDDNDDDDDDDDDDGR